MVWEVSNMIDLNAERSVHHNRQQEILDKLLLPIFLRLLKLYDKASMNYTIVIIHLPITVAMWSNT
jgi:hypothetical protein